MQLKVKIPAHCMIVLAATGYLCGCAEASAPVDRTPPTILSTAPTNGGNLMRKADLPLAIRFSEELDPLNVNSSTVTVTKTSTAAPIVAVVTYDSAARSVNITPNAALEVPENYTVKVAAAVTDRAGNPLGVDFQFAFTTGDGARPTVVSTTPANGATGVTIGAVMRATFSEPLDPASIQTNTIELLAVQGTTTYDASTTTLIFTPARPLFEKTEYTARLYSYVRDLSGLRIDDRSTSVEWKFVTVDNTQPRVYGVSPPAGEVNIQPNRTVTVRFDEKMDPATINPTSFFLVNRTTESKVAGTISLSQFDTWATLTPTAPLAAGTQYTVTVTTAAKDSAGNPLRTEFTSDFRTAATPDVIPPYVVSTTPAEGETGVRTNGVIRVIFSEWIDHSSMNTATFSLRNLETGEAVEGTVRQEGGNSPSFWIFTPRFELARNARYGVTLTTGIRDDAGNRLAADHSFSFTTTP